MKKALEKLPIQMLNYLFAHINSQDTDVMWLRSADDKRQLFVSPSYEKIWQQHCSKIYQYPDSWVETLLPDDIITITSDMDKRFHGVANTVYYRIVKPNGETGYIKDYSFPIKTNDQYIAMAGVSHSLNAEHWFEQVYQIKKPSSKKPAIMAANPLLDALEKEYQQCLTYNRLPNEYIVETNENISIKLTSREAQCLTLLLKGKITKVISRILNISPRTVEEHFNHIRNKLNCRNRMEILAKILNHDEISQWDFST